MAQVGDLWLLNNILGRDEETDNEPMIFRNNARQPAPIPPEVAKAVATPEAPPLDTSTPIREPSDPTLADVSGEPSIITITDPATGREVKMIRTPRGVAPAPSGPAEKLEPTWPPKPVMEWEPPPAVSSPPRQVGSMLEDDEELRLAQEQDARAGSAVGLGRMLFSSAMDLAGTKNPDMSFFDASQARHGGNAARLDARRKSMRDAQDQRIQGLGAQRQEDMHSSRMALEDPASPISRALQEYAVENGILGPEEAPNYPASAFGELANMLSIRQRAERPVGGSGKSPEQQAFDNFMKLEDLKTKQGFSEAMQGFKDNARDALALRYSSQMIGGNQWVAQPGKVTSANDQKKFAEVLTQHGKMADRISRIEEIYKTMGPEWVLGQGKQTMETNIGLLRSMTNVMTGQGAMSHGDGEALLKMIPDQNRWVHLISEGDFERAIDEIKRFSFSSVRHTARDYGFLHVSDPAAVGLKPLTVNTTYGPIQVPISTPGGKLQPPDPDGAHASDDGGSGFSYTRTSTPETSAQPRGIRIRRLSDNVEKTVEPELAEKLLRDRNKYVRIE